VESRNTSRTAREAELGLRKYLHGKGIRKDEEMEVEGALEEPAEKGRRGTESGPHVRSEPCMEAKLMAEGVTKMKPRKSLLLEGDIRPQSPRDRGKKESLSPGRSTGEDNHFS